jgi:hypothetical protein
MLEPLFRCFIALQGQRQQIPRKHITQRITIYMRTSESILIVNKNFSPFLAVSLRPDLAPVLSQLLFVQF